MLVSALFAVVLLVVVALFYLVPRKPVCAGCGAPRGDEPLCSCGWIHESPNDDADDDDGQEPEVIDDWEAR